MIQQSWLVKSSCYEREGGSLKQHDVYQSEIEIKYNFHQIKVENS